MMADEMVSIISSVFIGISLCGWVFTIYLHILGRKLSVEDSQLMLNAQASIRRYEEADSETIRVKESDADANGGATSSAMHLVVRASDECTWRLTTGLPALDKFQNLSRLKGFGWDAGPFCNVMTLKSLTKFLAKPRHCVEIFNSLNFNLMAESSWQLFGDDVSFKDRYAGIYPNPDTRVYLPQCETDRSTEYINANWIPLYQDVLYIATQGPLEDTVNDFWRMVWETNARLIVMSTGLNEEDDDGLIEKCYKYWPDINETPLKINDFLITPQESKNPYIRKLLLQSFNKVESVFGGAGFERTILHCWFSDWPDHGVPKSPQAAIAFVELVRRARQWTQEMKSPIIKHCSAGIGRTGVFLALDWGMNQIELNQTVDPIEILIRLRACRGGCVQNSEQWTYLLCCLQEYLATVNKYIQETREYLHVEDENPDINNKETVLPIAAKTNSNDIFFPSTKTSTMLEDTERRRRLSDVVFSEKIRGNYAITPSSRPRSNDFGSNPLVEAGKIKRLSQQFENQLANKSLSP